MRVRVRSPDGDPRYDGGGGGGGGGVRAIFQGFHNGKLPLACLLSCAHKAEGQERWRGEEIRAGEASDGQPACIHLSVASVKQTLSEKSQVMWIDDCQSFTLIEGFSFLSLSLSFSRGGAQ